MNRHTRARRPHRRFPSLLALLPAAAAALGVSGCTNGGGDGEVADNQPQPLVARVSQSGPIQLTTANDRLFVVNKIGSDAVPAGRGSLSAVRVLDTDDGDVQDVLTEIPVGRDPHSVSLTTDETRLFVSNGADNTVSVIDLGPEGRGPYSYVTDIVVGSEPRGTAIVGDLLFVANFGDGTVTAIGVADLLVRATVNLTLAGGQEQLEHPFALTGLPSGDLWVSEFYARAPIGADPDATEGFDDGKDGLVGLIRDLELVDLAALTPLANAGFTADRSAFDPANGAVNATFQAPAGVDPTAVPQGAYFNQLTSIAYVPSTRRLYLPSIAAQPAPPVRFNVNVQSLVGVIDTASVTEEANLHTNLNAQIRDNFGNEARPATPFLAANADRLDRAFAADVTSIAIQGNTVALPSRAGSYMLHGTLDADGNLVLARDDRDAIARIPTTNLPNGVVLNADATRAYVASDLVGEVSVLDMSADTELARISTAATPTDATRREELLGQLAFFTGMGLEAQIDGNTDPRTVDTHRFRNMASDNNWSSCASCHPGGRADGVTWLFPTGPRQSVSLEGFFAVGSTIESALDTTDQKLSNWNGVRGSITDFNNNARNVQGGFGFTPQALATIDNGDEPGDVPDRGLVFNQGPRLGVSNALDFMTAWVATIRPLNRPSNLDADALIRGRTLFANNCAECHGGSKWTSSTRVLDLVRWPDPAFGGGAPLTPNLRNPAASVIAAFDADDDAVFEIPLVEPGIAQFTLDLTNPIEIRGLGGAIGQGSAGLGASFVPPSLLGIRNSPPYGHHGRAQSLEDVFEPIPAGGLGHPDLGLGAQQLADVLEFVRGVDADQPIVR